MEGDARPYVYPLLSEEGFARLSGCDVTRHGLWAGGGRGGLGQEAYPLPAVSGVIVPYAPLRAERGTYVSQGTVGGPVLRATEATLLSFARPIRA